MVQTGTVFIQKTAEKPEFFVEAQEVAPASWIAIEPKSSAREEEGRLAAAGWTFFFLPQPLKTRVHGFDAVKNLAKALDRLVNMVREKGCNAMQIDAVEAASSFGIPFLTVSAHPRHIQRGMLFVAQ